MKSNLKVFLKGIIDVSPLMIPVVPFGLIFGVLAIDVGFTPIETMAMSLIIFGGASQIVLLQLFSGGASSLVIISSVGAVNSRHLLYGAVVSEHLSDLKLIWKIIISYFLIDQAFAISNEYLKKNKNNNRYFHLVGGSYLLGDMAINNIFRNYTWSSNPRKTWSKFCGSFNFFSLIS